jgi:ATP-dependent DNA helicase PIF1
MQKLMPKLTMNSSLEKLNAEQLKALELIIKGENVFLTGQAGTGKSYILSVVKTELRKAGKDVAITSTTGCSGLIIGGTTIHRWAGIKRGELDFHELLARVRKNSFARKNWKLVNTLIIDEISMMPPDLFDKLEWIARQMRNDARPFGGIQIIISGDFCQLPPVKTDVFCFKARSWNTCIQSNTIYFKQNMRQSDREFQQLLSEIRTGEVTDMTKAILMSRIDFKVEKDGIQPTKLYSRRDDVDDLNELEIRKLISAENNVRRYGCKDIFDPPIENIKTRNMFTAIVDRDCQARKILDVAIGAQVMLVINLDIDAGLVNGSRGIVVRFEEQRPVVKFMNGIELIIKAHVWEFDIGEGIKISRIQIPLILSWAITIHKCQGSTLDCVEIDLGETIFDFGQFYTALSRVKTLDGLSITALDFKKVMAHPDVKSYYDDLFVFAN